MHCFVVMTLDGKKSCARNVHNDVQLIEARYSPLTRAQVSS